MAFLGRLLPSPKDGTHGTRKLFTRNDNIRPKYRAPNMTVMSPTLGASGSFLTAHHAGDGDNAFPSLSWTPPHEPNLAARTVEYLVVVEDIDVPLTGSTVVLGIFYGIPATKTTLDADQHDDFGKTGGGLFGRELTGGFKFCPVGGARVGKQRVWNGPRPTRGHGAHRYYFQVVALSSTIDRRELSQFPTKESFVGAIEGKVLGWGEWVGMYERK